MDMLMPESEAMTVSVAVTMAVILMTVLVMPRMVVPGMVMRRCGVMMLVIAGVVGI
ncbi:hypothetical protein GKA01_00260 [Gluconobacter kanchanaburiensis NBRC 103587]|uniref:Uncharacterized protein n=1 Tax=Gluconobacter kanchanaburiensis NBRC 103587 TaxID=1307948 RepID=A0A511B307_9PROT|nr:hypothetical protein AA103587_1732 [Gluconobacter kanchanaburiensis NBRC 103587]GEK94829.1 hypothetical protein GKA01_00260 [Gluconobacter kanchanaburiensis NBRC 103587]